MRYLSVCSGIEAASVAWAPLGWKPVAFSEIEPFPCAVLAHRFPDVPNWGDMTKYEDWPDADVDVLCGGTPCQSFSVAGLRKGLADPRGNLMLTFGAIAGRYRPRWLVWENVPGVLSSNGGRDFGAFLGMLGQLGYGFAYRVLDAQHVRTRSLPRAVPQRRRRVFVVGYLGDWRRAAAVLFDRESLSGHPAPRRETGQVAPTIPARSLGGGGLGTEFDLDGGLIPPVAGTLKACAQSGGFSNSADHAAAGYMIPVVANSGDVGYCLTASAQQSLDAETETETLVAVAFDLNQITSPTNRSQPTPGLHHTLPATSCPPHLATPAAVRRLTPVECERLQGFPDVQETAMFVICLDQQKADALAALKCPKSLNNVWVADAAGWRLSAEAAGHHSSTNPPDPARPVAVDVLIDLERSAVEIRSLTRSFSSASGAREKSSSHLSMPIGDFVRLAALTRQGLASRTTDGRAASHQGTEPSTQAASGAPFALLFGNVTEVPVVDVQSIIAEANPSIMSTTSHLMQSTPISDSTLRTLCYCVNRAIRGFIPPQIKSAPSCAIRITVSSGWTQVPYRNKPAADGPRYKAIGNSWATNCAEWIGERIAIVDQWSDA